MGLSASLTNALSGMAVNQASLEIVSRNVSNSGTPGYHKQSLNVIDTQGVNSSLARTGGLQRAFNQSLQVYYNTATSNSGYTSVQSDILGQLQTFFGKPGDDGSLDTMYASFENALQSLSTSPDDYASRSTVVSKAQDLASTLNTLASSVQQLRQETEQQMSSSVDTLNQSISSLVKINTQLADQTGDDSTRASLMDQRDRLVGQISEQIDVQVGYNTNGTVSLMTKTGVGILDGKASTFDFEPSGPLTADKQFNADSTQSNVGSLTLTTSSGLKLDVVQQNILQSGKLKSLIDLRDKTLVNAQGQLDQIASGLAQSFSTVSTDGTAASSGTRNGLSLDVSSIRDGNDFTLNYTQAGAQKSVRVVRVDDTGKLPLDYTDANGTRVIGANFATGAAGVANTLSMALGSGFAVSGSGNTVTVLDDGAANTTDVGGLTSHVTASALQGQNAFSLFTDNDGSDFTGSLDGKGQQLGFASRITVNPAIVQDNRYLVQSMAAGSLGDATRVNTVLSQLQNMDFASAQTAQSGQGSFRLGGSVSDMVSQTMDYTGTVAATATSDDQSQQQTMDSISERMDSEYGVNVDEEMARLLELQNAYAANSRVISTVEDLMNKLLEL